MRVFWRNHNIYVGLLYCAPVFNFDDSDFAMENCGKLDPAVLSMLGLHDYDADCLTGVDALHMKDGLNFGSESSCKGQLAKGKTFKN